VLGLPNGEKYLIEPESKDRIKERDGKSGKFGLLKRFLEWIAEGLDKSGTDKTCYRHEKSH